MAMNPVEIDQALTELCEQPFDAVEFPFAFLEAFGNKPVTLKRLRSGYSNKSDLGGLLQQTHLHLLVLDPGADLHTAIDALRNSPATSRYKPRLLLATDGAEVHAEDTATGEFLVSTLPDLPDHLGFFLPLAGISPVRAIAENAFDIRATNRLNGLYMALLKDNPTWTTPAHRHAMNHFMARLIFCFFAEDTGIFAEMALFSRTVAQMSAPDGSDTQAVLTALFTTMNTPREQRAAAGLPRWASAFPYVNGSLFAGESAVPSFSKTARSLLIHVGGLDWTRINPDIFGSMIQAVTDESERSALGTHYTSVPNILKVLRPLFLDDLYAQLEAAGTQARTLLRLRKRLTRIRVFDPACGSGNFLVIAYKELRAIEAEINARRGEKERPSDLPLTNFRGIELRDFSAEIARLALVIAQYQCDVAYLGQKAALAIFLPLKSDNWITAGNALTLDWLSVCPPTGASVRVAAQDLFSSPQAPDIDFENEGGETYLCGNPPYLGSTWQSASQKAELGGVCQGRIQSWKSLDYVAGWFVKAADYCTQTLSTAAFVSTNSICQGQQVPVLWPEIFKTGCAIAFAHTSFRWSNLAAHNAGVTVVIVAISARPQAPRRLYSVAEGGETLVQACAHINAYLVAAGDVVLGKAMKPLAGQTEMNRGNGPVDGGHLFLNYAEKQALVTAYPQAAPLIRAYSNSEEFINGKLRYCLWIEDDDLQLAYSIPEIAKRIDGVRKMRLASNKLQTRQEAAKPHRFSEIRHQDSAYTIVVPRVSSENRDYLPVGLVDGKTIIGDRNFALYDAPLWNLALIASRLHWVWIGTVCVRMRTDFSYSNTLGWNTFPVPKLTEKMKDDLTRAAQDILLAREAHFPATIAALYADEAMPADLRAAHERNDEVVERIFAGRRFKNDTDRLECLFAMYTKMSGSKAS